jgi:hypothetical protein
MRDVILMELLKMNSGLTYVFTKTQNDGGMENNETLYLWEIYAKKVINIFGDLYQRSFSPLSL